METDAFAFHNHPDRNMPVSLITAAWLQHRLKCNMDFCVQLEWQGVWEMCVLMRLEQCTFSCCVACRICACCRLRIFRHGRVQGMLTLHWTGPASPSQPLCAICSRDPRQRTFACSLPVQSARSPLQQVLEVVVVVVVVAAIAVSV